MRIYVGGSVREVVRDPDVCHRFVRSLGIEIVSRGHVLLNGCRSTLDQEIAMAAQEWLTRNGNPMHQILSYRIRGDQPAHSLGTVRYSALPDWNMNHPDLFVPEQIELADAAIFIAGSEGTFWARNWTLLARKPILGVPRFGGAGETIYVQELKRFRDTVPALAEDYETMNSLSDDVPSFAKETVRLSERLVVPRDVFVIMSFKREFLDVLASCREVCLEFDFKAGRSDESTSLERITPRIERELRQSAFVIADVSEASPNIFYEIGYAKALGKDVIVTARNGTLLPFDIGDVPTIFWEIQDDLKVGLRKRLTGLAGRYGR